MGVNVAFPGILQARRFHFSMGYGQNFICTIEMLPQFTLPAVDGTLLITDGYTTLSIPGCRLDEAHLTRSTHGHIIRVQILGPTWKWRLAGIDGVYNVRRPDGTLIPETRKSNQELATLLFQAMQVPYFDVSGLPSADGPFVDWRGALAFNELTWLCHQWGCDFGLDVQGTIARIWRLGVGFGLPSGGTDVTEDYGINLAEPPDAIKLYCSPTLYQTKLKLRPIMKDTDGTWKDWEDVSYNPLGEGTADGWLGVDPFDPLGPESDPELRRLAKQTYLKYFLVESQADGTWNIPDYGAVQGPEDILPLRDRLADDYTLEDQQDQKSAFLEGTFAIDEGNSLRNTADHTLCEVPFHIDKERGIAVTSVPVYKVTDALLPTEPDLYLVTSYHVREANKFSYAYYSETRNIASNGTGTLPVHRPDLVRRVVAEYSGTSVTSITNNNSTLAPAISAQLDAVQAEFQIVESKVKWYVGIAPITLNGVVRQVSIFGSTDSPCYTIASANTEWECGLLSRRRRRLAAETDRRRVRRELDDKAYRDLYRKGTL